MRLFTIAILCILLFIPSSQAYHRGMSGQNINSKGVLNIGSNEIAPSNLINILKSCSQSFQSSTDIIKLDANGYLTIAPAINVQLSCNSNAFYSGVHYRIINTGTRSFPISLNSCSGGWTQISGSASTGGCTGGAGFIQFTGAAEYDVVINSPSFFLSTTGTFSAGTGEIAIVRTTDRSLYASGQYWTNEFINEINGAAPLVCRFMGMIINGGFFNGEVKWNYRMQTSQFTWGNPIIPPTIIAGGGSAAITWNAGDSYTASPATDTPGTITANEQFIGIFSQTNGGTTPTLNINSRGAIPILEYYGNTLAAGDIQVNTPYAMFYDAVLNGYVISGYQGTVYQGIETSVPYEALAQLANLAVCDPWINIPAWADDTYATDEATLIQSNINSSRKVYFEYGNEIWNFGFPQTSWANARGQALGFSTSSNQAVYGYYGIRVRQVMATDIPSVWTGGATATNYQPVLAYQAAGDTTNQGNRFEGQQLCPVASGGSCAGNSAYNSFTGTASWNASPNRPIDAVKVLAIAPYAQGENMCNTPDAPCAISSVQAPFWQSLISNWENGQIATAMSSIDTDLRVGRTSVQTVTASGTTFTTPSAHGFTAGSTSLLFSVSGGTTYSGIAVNQLYQVDTTPTSNTFTMKAYSGGFVSGSDVNAGSVGTGTTSVGISNQQSIVHLAGTWEAFAETNAVRYNGGAGGSRPSGFPNLVVRYYEGNLELQGLTSAQCTTMSIVAASCVNSSANAVAAYLGNSLSAQAQWDYLKSTVGTYAGIPNFGNILYTKSPAQLVLNGGGVYGLVNGYTPNFYPRETYFGFQNFNINP